MSTSHTISKIGAVLSADEMAEYRRPFLDAGDDSLADIAVGTRSAAVGRAG
jgi:hypothetical protein